MSPLRSWLVLFGVLLTVLAIAAEPPAKAPEVPVIRPTEREIAEYADFVGRTEAAQRVDVRAQLSAYLTKVNFRDGDEVKQGEVLFELDSRPYRAALDVVNATLAQAEARLKLADVNQKRAAAAFAQKAVAQAELDQAVAALDAARAGW